MFQLLKLKNATCSQAADIGKRKITSIQNELGHNVSPETIANALAQGFKAMLKIQLEPGELTPTRWSLQISSTKKNTLQKNGILKAKPKFFLCATEHPALCPQAQYPLL